MSNRHKKIGAGKDVRVKKFLRSLTAPTSLQEIVLSGLANKTIDAKDLQSFAETFITKEGAERALAKFKSKENHIPKIV